MFFKKSKKTHFICFSGLNFVDLMVRQGVLDSPPKTPVTMGFECAGEVEAVGDNTQGVAVSRAEKNALTENKDSATRPSWLSGDNRHD